MCFELNLSLLMERLGLDGLDVRYFVLFAEDAELGLQLAVWNHTRKLTECSH